MGSYQNPVGGGRDPYEKLRVERIEEDKLTQNEREKNSDKPVEEGVGVFAFILQTVRNIADFFLEVGSSKSVGKDPRENLALLKASFQVLKKEDRSQDGPFLQELARIWQQVLEDNLGFSRDSVAAEKFKGLVRQIQHYPENQPHTLGYYLEEHAGQQWIPFPYMDLIQKLHSEHEKAPATSALTQWVILIDELISLPA